jgi:thiamine kinase-like enzyme
MDEPLRALLAKFPVLAGAELAVEPLSGGLTNRNYRVRTVDRDCVLRVAGADTHLLGIDRACEFACQRAAAAAGIAPQVIAFLPRHGALLMDFCAGRTLAAADFGDPRLLRRAAEQLRRCHEVPMPNGVGTFSAFRAVRSYYQRALERNVALPSRLPEALAELARLEQKLAAGEPPCLCHNDLLPANFIDDGTRLSIIDWEYAGAGDRFFDLGNFAVNLQLDDAGEKALLTAYFGADRADDRRRLRLMRRVSDLREAMWGAVQAGISTLHSPDYYLDYGRKHLERFLSAGGRP